MACPRSYPPDWQSHIIPSISTKSGKRTIYHIEVIEFTFCKSGGDVLLCIPGYFQNAFVFDLLPDRGISLARYLSEQFGFRIFVLHPNGIGRSEYIGKSDLDDMAIDDIETGIHFIRNNISEQFYVFAHSTGAITLQAYLGGLTRYKDNLFFNLDKSKERQDGIIGICLAAGNVFMTDDKEQSGLKKRARLGIRLRWLLNSVGWINVCLITRWLSPTKGIFKKKSFAYSKMWQFLYHRTNVCKASQEALYRLTLDGTSARTLLQYSKGVITACIHTFNDEKSYSEALMNIRIPVCQVTFEFDPMAVPRPTKRDNYHRLGSRRKLFYIIPGQGHEDFLMHRDFHSGMDSAFQFLLSGE